MVGNGKATGRRGQGCRWGLAYRVRRGRVAPTGVVWLGQVLSLSTRTPGRAERPATLALLPSADHGLVHFHFSGQQRRVVGHEVPDLLRRPPRGLVGHTECPREFRGGNPVA